MHSCMQVYMQYFFSMHVYTFLMHLHELRGPSFLSYVTDPMQYLNFGTVNTVKANMSNGLLLMVDRRQLEISGPFQGILGLGPGFEGIQSIPERAHTYGDAS